MSLKYIDNLRWFKPGILSKYPGIQESDFFCIHSFWANIIETPNRVAYNVPVSPPFTYPPQTPFELTADWDYLASYKADMLFDYSTYYTIAEVTSNARARAIGQLLTYRRLFIKSFDIHLPVSLLLICSSIDENLRLVFADLMIDIFVASPSSVNFP